MFSLLNAGCAVFQSKVSFISRDLLLDDFDSEPMKWRMKQDDLQEVVSLGATVVPQNPMSCCVVRGPS